METQVLLEKINTLPLEKINEVEDFVDFLKVKILREAKDKRHHAIAEYAEKHAGSDVDFDEEIEEISLEFIVETEVNETR